MRNSLKLTKSTSNDLVKSSTNEKLTDKKIVCISRFHKISDTRPIES